MVTMKSSESPIMNDDGKSKYGEKLNYDPEFHGPTKSRSCTDPVILFLFVAFLAGWGVVGFFAFREGDPKTLLYPTDSDGNICGVDKLKDKPYLYFFNLIKCATAKIILTGCPTQQVCVSQCPQETFYVENSDSNDVKKKLICKYDVKPEEKDIKTLIEDGLCGQIYLKSTALFQRCIPDLFFGNLSGFVKNEKNQKIHNDVTVESVKNATEHLARFLSVTQFGEKIFSDFKTSWKYMIGGLVLSMLISLVWIILMRWIAGPMIWISIILVLVSSAYGCYYSSNKYVQLKNTIGSEDEHAPRFSFDLKNYLAVRDTWLYFAIITGLVFAILFLVIIALRKRIKIAVALIKEASKAVSCIWTSLAFPLLTYIMMLAFFAFWIAVALYIASSGRASFVISDAPEGSDMKNGEICNPKNYDSKNDGIKCLFRTYGLKNNIFSSHAYNLFALFWGLFFTVGIGQVSLAGAFSAYYWTRRKSDIPTFAMATGFCRCLRYHLGSVALGSLLIAIVRFIRVMFEFAVQKLNKYDNGLVKCLLRCMRCCFWCLENVLQFINKNAYIMIAVHGHNFCLSAKHAFMLLMRNVLRVVVLDKITDFLLFLGKLVVVACTAGVSFYFFSTDQKIYTGLPQLNYNLVPPIVITLGSYLIASGFFSVYGMAVDTLFLCFLEDCERNDGSEEKPYFMSKELMKILHKKNKFRDLLPPDSKEMSQH